MSVSESIVEDLAKEQELKRKIDSLLEKVKHCEAQSLLWSKRAKSHRSHAVKLGRKRAEVMTFRLPGM